MRLRQGGAALALAVAAGAACAAQTTEFPSRPIRFVVTFPPGGGTDLLARMIGAELAAAWGQNVIIDNRPGASGNIGADIVAKSQPDGYTILMVNSTFAMNAGLFQKLPFDVVRDFAPIVMVASVPSMLAVNPRLPVKTMAEFVAHLRANPGRLSYASCGNGTPQHLAGELLKSLGKVEMTHVPYKGCAPALVDVLGGQVDVSFNTVPNSLPHVRSGKLRALGVTSLKRFPLVPDVPAIAEAGLAGYDVDQWFGVLATGGTPRAVVDRLNGAIAAIVRRPEVVEKMQAQSYAPMTSSPEAFAKTLREDVARWSRLIRDIGIRVD